MLVKTFNIIEQSIFGIRGDKLKLGEFPLQCCGPVD